MAAKNIHILAIDLGTHGPKVALVAPDGEIAAWEFEPTKLMLLPGGGAEQEPDDWWRAITTAVGRLRQKAAGPYGTVVAVCCTSQWSGTVAVDQDGNALRNAIIWMDTRGARYLESIVGGGIKVSGYGLFRAPRWLRLTGGLPAQSGKDPIAHILYLRNEEPEIYERAYKLLEPKDYLNLRLTGVCAAGYDSIALHFITNNRDLNQIGYDAKLVDRSCLDPAKLPRLLRAVDVLAPLCSSAAAELGLAPNTRVVMGTPDVQSAAIGSGAVADYQGHLYVGTSSWVSCHVPFKKTGIRYGIASLPSAIPDRYIVADEQESAGACIDYFLDRVIYPEDPLAIGERPVDAFERLEATAASAPAGSDKVIFTPWMVGERTPVDSHTIRGCFFNLNLRTERHHLARAVYEGVAYNTQWLVSFVQKFTGRPFPCLDFIGGGAESALWCQIHADVLGFPIRQAAAPRLANVRGAGWIGAVALGELRFADIPALAKHQRTYEPNPSTRAMYDDLIGAYRDIYEKTKGICARLNG